MTQITVKHNLVKTVEILESVLSPKLYWIHNCVGNRDWEVRIVNNKTVVSVNDPKMLTYLLLKIK